MSYWNSTGRHQSLADQLAKLVPTSGPCSDPHLEHFRQACNCYYDYFNNGLCNRTAEFQEVFGFPGTKAARAGFPDAFTLKLDTAMDEIVLLAAKEQHISP